MSETIIAACPHDCPDTCSMLVNVEDGKVTSVRGNPDHPFTRGRLCVKVNSYQDRVHSPDRVLYPLRRSGPKGSGEFERISWDQALEGIGSKWRAICADAGPQSILPYSYLGTEGSINGLTVGDPFFNRLGATVAERTFCDSGACTGYAMTIGDSAAYDPESVVHAEYIIFWACNALTTNSHIWPFVLEARKNGAKVIVIDPYKTRTARQADWHIPIKPGTDAALTLSIINVMIGEGLIDENYVENHTVGYDELAERAAQFAPEVVEPITGIPADDIRTLAREFAQAKPAVIRMGVAIERHSGGGQTVRALACLSALAGHWQYPGGGLLQLPIWAFPMRWDYLSRADLLPDDVRVLNLWKLGAALTGQLDLDPPIQSLFVYNSNPVVTAPQQADVLEGLKRSDLFTVVSEQFLTDTARYADIVLPATTQVEQEDIMFSWGHLYLSYNNKAIEPIGEAVSNSELFRRLAKTMAFDDDPYFTRSDEQMIEDALDWDSPALEGISLKALKKIGFARLNVPKPGNYLPHKDGNFHTPSGKCEFKASLAENGNFVVPLFRQGYEGQQLGDPVDPLPNYIPPQESADTNPALAAEFPLQMLSPKNHAFITSCYGDHERNLAAEPDQYVVINSRDAERRKVVDGNKVEVRNHRGSFEAVAKINDDVMPGVVVAPVGYWLNREPAGTVHQVNSDRFADLGAAPTFSDVLVEVAPLPASAEEARAVL